MNQENKEKNPNHPGNASPKPDPETLNTTDPQEHMRGPVSSTTKGTGHAFETDETKRDADRKKDEKM